MESYDVAPIEGYHPEIGLLLASLADSTREWQEQLESPSTEAIKWQPVPGFHSVGALILHNIEVEMYWFEEFVGGREVSPDDYKLLRSEDIDQMNVNWPIPPAEPIEWYYDHLARFRARAWEVLMNENPERIIARKNYETSVRWVVAHVVEHDSYHGGQAVLLHELYKKMVQQ